MAAYPEPTLLDVWSTGHKEPQGKISYTLFIICLSKYYTRERLSIFCIASLLHTGQVPSGTAAVHLVLFFFLLERALFSRVINILSIPQPAYTDQFDFVLQLFGRD